MGGKIYFEFELFNDTIMTSYELMDKKEFERIARVSFKSFLNLFHIWKYSN